NTNVFPVCFLYLDICLIAGLFGFLRWSLVVQYSLVRLLCLLGCITGFRRPVGARERCRFRGIGLWGIEELEEVVRRGPIGNPVERVDLDFPAVLAFEQR